MPSTPRRVRTRFAPSPTGHLHVGSLRTALYCFLYARKHQGDFILRIEDTDKTREVAGGTEELIRILNMFGLHYDEGPRVEGEKIVDDGPKGPYIQSRRLDLYKKYAQQLVDGGKAYHCFCTSEALEQMREQQMVNKQPSKYDKRCRTLSAEEVAARLAQNVPHVIRLDVTPGRVVAFTDLVHGEVSFNTADIDDQVLLKSDGYPTYHLANVVDDHFMEMSHVIRGDEWMPSTPKHLLIFEAFGWTPPEYAHLPLLLSAARKKLSKRDGDVAVEDFLKKGYLKEALLNFVALLGWNPGAGSEQEVFSLEQLNDAFSLEHVNKSGAVFDVTKLDWINGLYIRTLSTHALAERCAPYLRAVFPGVTLAQTEKIVSVERERLKKLEDIAVDKEFYFAQPAVAPTLLVWKKSTAADAKRYLEEVRDVLIATDATHYTRESIEPLLLNWVKEKQYSNGDVLWPLRVALSGKEQSPSPFELIHVLGKEETVARISAALGVL